VITASTTITVNSRWWGEHIQCDVIVTRVTDHEVSYRAIYHPFAGVVPQWKFLDQFQPVPVQKKKAR
jgi:hypothetical protein